MAISHGIVNVTYGSFDMGRPPSPDRDKFIIRLPNGMRDQIKDAADANNRTMTAEIVARLRQTFGETEPATDTSVADLEATVRILMTELDRLRYDVRTLEAKVSRL